MPCAPLRPAAPHQANCSDDYTSTESLSMAQIVRIQAHDLERIIAMAVASPLPSLAKDEALPSAIVWMPAGVHAITAGTMDGETFSGKVICDEQGSRVVASSFEKILSEGGRVWLDLDHDDGAAAAWVKSFSWDSSKGILAHVEWTPRGESAIRGKEYFSFSPAFEANRTTGRLNGIVDGHAAGGLVNAPAFKAMPALIAARFGGTNQTAPGGKPEIKTMNDLLIKLLAALKITAPANATEADLIALVAKNLPADHSAEITAITAKLTATDNEKLVAAQARQATENKISVLETKLTETQATLATVQARRVDVGQSDMTDVLAAYASKDPAQFPASEEFSIQRANLAVERAVIFARDIQPRLQVKNNRAAIRGELHSVLLHARDRKENILKIAAKNVSGTVQIFAANSLGTLSGSLIAQNSLSLLKADLPALNSFSTDFSNSAAKLNQTIITRVRGLPTVQTYNPATGYVKSDVSAVDVPVTINAHRFTQFDYNANELASTNRDLFGEQAEGSVYVLGKDMLDTALALFTLANFPLSAQKTITATAAAFVRSVLVDLRVALRKRKVQIKDGFLIANEDYFGGLAKDPVIVALAQYQRPELITEYILPKIAGFQPAGYVDLPTTGNLVAVAGSKECLAIAARLPYDYVDAQIGSNYGSVTQITDPGTGLSVMLTQYVNHDAGASRYRLALMSGSAVGDSVRAQLVVSA